MIAAWMFYCMACASVFAVAAFLAERSLVAGRTPVRFVWIAAAILSCVVPAIAFRYAGHPTITIATPTATPALATQPMLGEPTTPAIAAQPVAVRTRAPLSSWTSAKAIFWRANRPLAIGWIATSSALALYLAFGFAALMRIRRRCYPREVLGVNVLVSDRTGPAIVGVVRPAIVMPEWALAMETSQLALMLQHEEEHRRAHDVPLLAVAQLALVAMPWNVALWWIIVRLGLAIELDCDARVLRDADPRSYGDLLLEVARPRQGFPLLGATAFAERASGLEMRIRTIAARRIAGTRRARALAVAVGAIALTVAWTTPRPVGTPPLEFTQSRRELPLLSMPPVAAITAPARNTRVNPTPIVVGPHVAPPVVDTRVYDSLVRLNLLPPTPARATSPIADSAFNRLFAGLTLSPERESAARGVLIALEQRQLEQLVSVTRAAMQMLPVMMAMVAPRDSALRALLANDTDRATFDANVAQRRNASPGPGRGRARSGGRGAPALDTSAVTRLQSTAADVIGGARGGRSGGGDPASFGRARSGGPPGNQTTMVTPVFNLGNVDDELRSLFSGIALTADQQTAAHAIADATRRELLPLLPVSPMDQLMLLPNGAVLMRPEAKAALMSLLETETDRATLESRISIETRIVVRNPPDIRR